MDDTSLRNFAEQTRPPELGPLQRTGPERHREQRPIAFVQAYLLLGAVMVGLVAVGVHIAAREGRGLGEPVPNYTVRPENRLDRPVAVVGLETTGDGRAARLLVVDDQTFHVGEFVKDLLYWQRVPLRGLREHLVAPEPVGLTADDGRLVVVSREGFRCGMDAFTFPTLPVDLTPWRRPVTDLSYFPGVDDTNATAVVYDPRAKIRLVAGIGVGLYLPDERRWLPPLTRQSHGLASEFVTDLEFLPGGPLAVMGDAGIDIGAWSEGTWVKRQHFDRRTGLAGDHVRHGRLADGDLVYLTAGGGLGRLRLDAAGQVLGADVLVAEGRAPGLDRKALRGAAEDRSRERVWMVYQAPGGDKEEKKLLLYRYRAREGHHMLAAAPEDAWPAGTATTLRADPYGAAASAWVGGDGLRLVKEPAAPGDRLLVHAAGLTGHQVHEIAVHPHAVFAQTTQAADGDAPTVQAAPRAHLDEKADLAWARPYIGPRRFPGLGRGDLQAASDGTFDDRPALYFGTRDKGVGVFTRDTRELFQAHHSKHPDPERRPLATFDNVLDLSARGNQLFVVSEERALAVFDGAKWLTMIQPGGIDIRPEDVRTLVARGNHVVVGSANKIGHYRTDTHAWQPIPPVADLERLVLAIDHLWAIDKQKKLHAYPLAGERAQAAWKEQETDLIDIYGDADVVVVLAGKKGAARLWAQEKDRPRKELVSTKALPAGGKTWTAAAAGGRLYVAPHANGIGQYEIATHQWKELAAPPGVKEPARRLVATPAGLWLLDADGALFCLPRDAAEWRAAATKVKWLGYAGAEVIALGQGGHVWVSKGGLAPMALLVGDAFAQPLTQVRAGAVFKEHLFVATDKQVGRYDADTHRWVSYDARAVPGAAAFAHTQGYLYLRATDGHVARWQENDDSWQTVQAGGQPLRAEQIAAGGGSTLFVRQASGAVLAIADRQPDAVRTVIAASALGKVQITAAAEVDRELFVGLDDGRVATYGRPQADGPRTWSTLLDGKGKSAVRQLLAAPGQPNRLAAVSDAATLLERANRNAPWEGREVLRQEGLAAGALTKNDFYGFCPAGDKRDAQIWRVRLGPGSGEPAALLGPRFPVDKRTAAVGVGPGGELFRAGESKVARYDFAAHAWRPSAVGGVRAFFNVGEQIWAWAPADGVLHRWQAAEWSAERKEVRHAVGDGTALAFLDAHGALHVQTPQETRTVVPRLPEALPIKGLDDLVALAQAGDTLFVAARDQPLLAYDRRAHSWQVSADVKGVAEFARIKGPAGAGALFARTDGGAVYRRDAAGAWEAVAALAKVKVTALAAADEHLAARADDGGIYLLDGAGQVKHALVPRPLAGRKAADLRPRAAAELDGKLLLIPDPKLAAGELWVYDPGAAAWETHKLEGTPERFLPSANGLWLRASTDKGLTLYRVAGNPPQPQPVHQGLLDAVSDGSAVWVLTARHEVRRLAPNGDLAQVPGVPETALPEGRKVHRAFGAADSCVVLLDDGSVHHYSETGRKWEEKIPALTDNSMGKDNDYLFKSKGTLA